MEEVVEKTKASTMDSTETNLILQLSQLIKKITEAGKSLDEYRDDLSDRGKLKDLFREYGVDEVTTVSA
ncbi:MAG: hypothetical protein IJ228_07740 [Succinivibrio sp.]|nr:hypothetical protein [Succinivibrio sp.]